MSDGKDRWVGIPMEEYLADKRIIEQAQAVCILYLRFGSEISSPLWAHMNGLCDEIKEAGYNISVKPSDCK